MDGPEGEAAQFAQVVRKLLHRIPPQTSQDHVMFQVVLWVPDGHVLEQSAICSENVIRPEPDLFSIPPHDPCADILQPRLMPWEEVQAHALQPHCRKLVRNGLTPWCALRIYEIGIEVACHQDIGPARLIPDDIINVLYGQRIAGENIAPHNMPPPPPCHHMKADEILDVEVELFDRKLLRIVVKIARPPR